MSDLSKILLTSFLTVVSGTILYVITRAFIELIIDFRKLTAEIIDTIVRYKFRIVNPGRRDDEQIREAQNKFNDLKTRLLSKGYAIPWYPVFAMLKLIIKRDELEKIVDNLNKLSANISITDPETIRQLNLPGSNIELANEIGRILDFRFDPYL
ncbi:MAG: hypothetical protein FJ126_04065 [Deltaproteobacteria bacterium]|nr:hypothetical protein [Deltaproteobacteria bacterium]